jgi:hypothetical protein
MKSEFEVFQKIFNFSKKSSIFQKNLQYLTVTWWWSLGSRKSFKFKHQDAPLVHPLILKVTQAVLQKWSLGSAVDFLSYLICTIKGM